MYAVQTKHRIPINLKQLTTLAATMTPTFFFEGSDGHTLRIGLGAVSEHVTLPHHQAYAEARQWLAAVKGELPIGTDVAVMGGFPFESTGLRLAEMAEASVLFLPQLSLLKVGPDTFDVTAIDTTAGAARSRLDQFLAAVQATVPRGSTRAALHQVTELKVEAFRRGVEQTVRRLQTQSDLKKVVLSRRLQATAEQAFLPETEWLRIRRQNPETYHILLKSGSTAFLSSTPERLLKMTGDRFETAAVAGTTPRGATTDQDVMLGRTLLRDAKNRWEHDLVVTTIDSILRTAGVVATHRSEPILMKNRTVQHLYTPFSGVVGQSVDAFALAGALHPTPALGGLPTAAALTVIAEVEQQPRGLFGAPIGYVSLTGEAEFAVGIRSAQLRGVSATLFAGAGIVAESVAENEIQETRLKFRPMMETLFKRSAEQGGLIAEAKRET